MSNNNLTHENFDFRGFDVPDLKAVTLTSSSGDNQSKQPETKHGDASRNRKHGKKKPKFDTRSKKRAGAGKTSESFDDYEDYEKREAVNKADKKVSKDRPGLFAPMTLHEVTVRNHIWLSPMCTYLSFAHDGGFTPLHYQHYVSHAFGGFGMVIVESTIVTPEERTAPCDLGLWEDGQIDAWRWVVDGIRETDAVPAIQLNHAGHRASVGYFAVGYSGQSVPEETGGWPTIAPSEITFGGSRTPCVLSVNEAHGLVGVLAAAVGRAVAIGFQVIQTHAAHGYLILQFLDPLSNERGDEYGGDLTGRSRFLVEIVGAVRGAVPEGVPILVRISATDWATGGWDLDQVIALSKVLEEHGVDVMGVSTGGIMSGVSIPVKPNYQVPFSGQVKVKTDIPMTTVGLITKPKQAAKILTHDKTDAMEIDRAALRDPYWLLRVANKLSIPLTKIFYAPQCVVGAC